MSRIAHNTRLAVAFVIVLLMLGAAAGRAIPIHHSHSAHVRALAVDGTYLMCAFTPLAVSAFVLPVPQARRPASRETSALGDYESVSLSHPITRPPPALW